jgi:hypothetical protein
VAAGGHWLEAPPDGLYEGDFFAVGDDQVKLRVRVSDGVVEVVVYGFRTDVVDRWLAEHLPADVVVRKEICG